MDNFNSEKRKHSQEDDFNAKRFHSEEQDEIKQFSSDQRLALEDEPICVVCGKYGEYINDDTDQDVCSLQCKAINNDLNPKRKKNIKSLKHKVINTQLHDYIAPNLHAKLTHYQEPASIASQSATQVSQMLQAHDLTVIGSHLPKPFSTYDQLLPILGPTLLENIESLGWSMATGVQRQAVTAALAGRDLIVTAPTHSGKTGAFLIPTIVHAHSLSQLDGHKRRAGPYALILAPTHELCRQIEQVCQALAKGLPNLRTGLLIGGEPLPNQLYRLKRGVQVLVGTPGRVLECMMDHAPLVRCWRIQMVVLDEVDAIFKMGFGVQVRQILGKFGTVGQMSLFSATLRQEDLERLTKRLRSPIEIRLARAVSVTPSPHVRQTVIWVENKSKAKRLMAIIQDPKYFVVPILIFVASKLGAEFLTRAIQKKNPHLKVVAMHGDRSQEERSGVMEDLQKAEIDIVVSTDILARGMDLPSVRLVINYDMAATLEDYIHRIGRAILQYPVPKQSKQKIGWSITFINQEHHYLLESFAKMLSEKSPVEVTPLPTELKRYL